MNYEDPIDYALCDALILAMMRSVLPGSLSAQQESDSVVELLAEYASPVEVALCEIEALARLSMDMVDESYFDGGF